MTDVEIAAAIRSMAEGLTPVAPLKPVHRRVAAWATLSTIAMVVVTWLTGVRRDLSAAAWGAAFLAQVVVMSTLAGVAAAAALRLAVPGAARQRDRVWALGVLGLWPVMLAIWALLNGRTIASLAAEPLHLTCARTIGMIALVPAILLTVMIRRGAALRPYWASMMTGAAAAGVGAVGVVLTCPIASVSHVLIAHALPTVTLAGLFWVATSWAVRLPPSRMLAIIALVATISAISMQVAAAGPATGELPPFRVIATTGG